MIRIVVIDFQNRHTRLIHVATYFSLVFSASTRVGHGVVPYRNLVAPANNLAVSFVDTKEDGTVGNALFSFELQSGSYATMLLRELMFTTMSRKDGN